ncbi:MAG: PKD domain-containing protein [Chitinophagaceae bacterium]
MIYHCIALALFFLLRNGDARGQVQADFMPDKTSGCAPLVVSFKNTSIGASANATYQWDFGNGNTSVLKDAAANFYIENTFTVSLTVKDGQSTSIKSKTITVYKRPAPDFTVSPVKDCLPYSPVFNSSSTAGDGTITSIYWDFGDGSTQQTNSPQITHTYNFPQTTSVTLAVTNSFGCSNTITKKNIITVLPQLIANFSTNRHVYCLVSDEVHTTNNSTGPGTLSYEWDFGDGTKSTDKAPAHIYAQKGIYTITLTVTSSEGCVDTRKTDVNIASYLTDFQATDPACVNNFISYFNTSSPSPDSSTWYIDDVNVYKSIGSNLASIYSTATGIHQVKLLNSFEGCMDSITKAIDIKPGIDVKGFIADLSGVCGSPVKVNFKDTTSGAVKWLWSFSAAGNATATIKEPSYTYTKDDLYYVTLTATNAQGCSQTVGQNVYISKPLVGIFTTDAAGDVSCGTVTKGFEARSTENIVSYTWNFGDGTTSTDAAPQHTYTLHGSYPVTLNFTTASGCTGTATYNNIIVVQEKIVADFTGPVTVCGNTPVTFHSTSTGDVTTIIWDYGDNIPGYGYFNTHKFNAEGDYTIKMIALNYGCADTVVKTNYIHVSPPFPQIADVANTCDGNRSTVTFTDGTVQAQSWKWDFGDSTSTTYTSAVPTITHSYLRTGRYKVMLTTTNGTCTVKDSIIAYVLLRQQPQLSASSTGACVNSGIPVKISNLERPLTPSPYDEPQNYPPYTVVFQHPDGSSVNAYASGNNSIPWIGSLTFPQQSHEAIQAVTISNPYFGCRDTSNIIQLNIKGPVAAMKVLSDNVCFKNAAAFQDISLPGNNVQIVKWEWDFGDGNSVIASQGGTLAHVYREPGLYYIRLSVTDKDGCTSSTPAFANAVQITGPRAGFNPSGTDVPLNTTVNFSNTSNTYNSASTIYHWNFGDGQTSTDFSPNHTYPVAGTYTIQLIATNSVSQCSDTLSKTITVRNFNYAFSTSSSFIGNGGKCAPALVNFTNTSSNYTRVVWDFGDGFTLENQNYPSHIYTAPGKYIVTLYVYGFNGLAGTFKDSVNIGSSAASIHTDVLTGCEGQQVKLNAPVHAGNINYTWDFGDGTLINTTDSFAVNNYLSAGEYIPSLISTDANGCSSSVSLNDTIVINPAPTISISPESAVVCKGVSVQLQADGADSYTWSPANGLNNINSSTPVAAPANTTTYTVEGKDNIGCTGSNTITVTVPQPFTLSLTPDAAICVGDQVQITAGGATSYTWINAIDGLSNTQISNPVASPSVTTDYTVIGSDAYQCYNDTGFVKVTVYPLPTVNAGPDIEAIIGSDIQLNAITSSDVINLEWSPVDYLSCTNCASTVSRPRAPVDYTITVKNEHNCIAKDDVKITVACAGGQVYIPSAFSPNNDGKNDRFVILGNGVRIVKSLRIYNRWGNLVFEKKEFYPGDTGGAWDGMYKGIEAPVGSYVYIAEMECNANETFVRKGTVTLVR